jgi:hypothetical protein
MRPQRRRDIRLLGEAEAQFDTPDPFRQILNNNPGVLGHPRSALGGYLQQHQLVVQHAVVFQI